MSRTRHCVAAHSLSHLGPEGYHWRVMMEDKVGAAGADRTFSWWDIQDGNAKLPVQETSQYELRKLLFPSPKSSSTDTATKAAKGAFKMMGKAMASAIGDEGGVENQGPPVSVIVVKMLDLNKIHEDINLKYGGGHAPATPRTRCRRATAPTPVHATRTSHSRPQPPRQPLRQPDARRAPAPAAADNLMNFRDAPMATPLPSRVVQSSISMSTRPKNESRAQMLKRQQEERMKKTNRVWDDVDQRWVEVDPSTGSGTNDIHGGTTGVPIRPKKKEVGVKLDMSNAAGKSAKVQQAMQARVNEMNATAQKAVNEVKTRMALEKKREEEEDAIRIHLEPKIKAWSEEHGKKKQLQALLASLHTILWSGAKWKPISIGDILQPAKVKKFYFKATLVVHPDKTGDLPAEQRFLAKRIFDALTQAKTVWDESQRR